MCNKKRSSIKEVELWPLQCQFSLFLTEFDGNNVGNQL
jgi:hypothetical protein